MNVIFNCKKAEISDEQKHYAEKKLGKLDRYFQKDAGATIKFKDERGRYTAEATVQSDKLYFRAEETTGDIYASIDGAVDSIERQIRKNKTRLEKRLRVGAFDKEYAGEAQPEDRYELIRRKRFVVRPMSVEEAILQMNLLGHEFFFFVDDESQAHAVVYRRKDGGYGLIESEE